MQCHRNQDTKEHPAEPGAAQSAQHQTVGGQGVASQSDSALTLLLLLAKHAPDAQVHVGRLVSELQNPRPNLAQFLPHSRRTPEVLQAISSALLLSQPRASSEKSLTPASSSATSSLLRLEARLAALESAVSNQASLFQDLVTREYQRHQPHAFPLP